jgi:cell division septation protein DedD
LYSRFVGGTISADVSTQTHDDGFHEIQLNGKQLVFLFMAATVVSVVIFLCGVLVGRGVRTERLIVAAQADALAEPTADRPAPLPAPVQPAADVTKVEAPPVADELSASNRLEKTVHPVDEVRPDPPKTAVAPDPKPGEKNAATDRPASARTPSSERASTPAARPPATAANAAPARPAPVKDTTPQTSEPAAAAPAGGAGYAVQVAAVNVRSEADAIAKRLASKGYSTYVQMPTSGANGVFRVRVGTFKTRREAETVATRLEKEEQIKPWVTR